MCASSFDSPLPGTIREINDLPRPEKQAIYRSLIPGWVYSMFDIDPTGDLVRLRCPAGSNAVEISVFHAAHVTDPVLYLHMGDTFNAQLAVLMVVVNDPASPRFNVDVMPDGTPTQLGTNMRNIPEEIRAMRAGLAPGQIRRGLRIFRTAVPLFDAFVARMGHPLYFVDPLFYHNAITFERYGLAYARGGQKMHEIHREFLPGGTLHAHLDASTPFRAPDAWRTVLGRSWAIHDCILDRLFDGVQMYKQVGKNATTRTFPDAVWS